MAPAFPAFVQHPRKTPNINISIYRSLKGPSNPDLCYSSVCDIPDEQKASHEALFVLAKERVFKYPSPLHVSTSSVVGLEG